MPIVERIRRQAAAFDRLLKADQILRIARVACLDFAKREKGLCSLLQAEEHFNTPAKVRHNTVRRRAYVLLSF
jgi:hypothetical protein